MSGKKIRSNKKQVEMLVDFMSTHNHLATGEFTGPLGSQKANAQWLRLKDLLKEYGPDRSIDQWKQTWKDLKKSARAENAVSVRAQNATGNATVVPVVSDATKKILDTIGHECSIGVGPEESAIGFITVQNNDMEMLVEDTFQPIPQYSLSLPPSPGPPSADKENVPSNNPRPRANIRPHVHETFSNLQVDHNNTLNEIRALLVERNGLLREQNSLLYQANRISRRNRLTRKR